MVHKPGLARARLRPPSRGVLPDRLAAGRSSTSTSASRGSSHPRRSSRSRSTRRSTRMTTRPARSSPRPQPRPGCRPTTRSGSGPTGCGRPPGRRRRAAVGRRAGMSLRLTHEVLHLGLRDPFRIARSDHAAAARRDDRRRRAPGRPVPGHRRGGGGLPGPVLRRDAGDDGRRLPAAPRRRRRDRPGRVRACAPPTWRWRPRSAVTARLAVPSTSRSTT